MSRENVELVLRLFERPRDASTAQEVFADDVEMSFHGDLQSLGQDVVGKRAVTGWFVDWFQQFEPDYRFDVHEVEDWENRVMVVATHHGRGRSSGVPIQSRMAWAYEVSDGRVVRCDAYSTREEALAATGGEG